MQDWDAAPPETGIVQQKGGERAMVKSDSLGVRTEPPTVQLSFLRAYQGAGVDHYHAHTTSARLMQEFMAAHQQVRKSGHQWGRQWDRATCSSNIANLPVWGLTLDLHAATLACHFTMYITKRSAGCAGHGNYSRLLRTIASSRSADCNPLGGSGT